MSSIELEGKIRELRQLQSLIKEAEAEAESIKDAIKAQMGRKEVLIAGEYTVTYKPVASPWLDVVSLREAYPELVERFTTTSHTRRFRVA